MSVRSIPRFVLAGLLAAALAAPAVAQNPVPEAPMPRPSSGTVVMTSPVAPFWWDEELPVVYPQKKPAGAVEIELSFDLFKPFGIELETQWSLGAAPAVAPMPREARTAGACCGTECCRQPAAAVKADQPRLFTYQGSEWLYGTPAQALPSQACPSATPVKVRETRTGQFIVTGSVNSDAGLTGDIVLNERTFDIRRLPTGEAKPCCGADCCRQPVAVTAQAPPGVAFGCSQVLRDDVYNLARVAPFYFPHPTPGLTTNGGFAGGFAGSGRVVHIVTPTLWVPPGGPVPLHLAALRDAARIQLVVADDQPTPSMCPPCPLPYIAANPLAGTWYRDTGAGVIAVTFTPDEMKLCLTQRENGNTATFTITAHYTLTKDGLVYGAVTGADVDAKLDGKAQAELGMELAEMSLMLQELTDRPFSFRTKATSAGLMVSQMKVASGEQIRGQELGILGGLYKFAKDGKVPAPAEPKPTAGRTGRADCRPVPLDVPVQTVPYPTLPAVPAMSEPIQRVGIDFSLPGQPVMSPPTGAPQAIPVCNDAMKAMAADAFGQLLKPTSGTVTGGMTLPSGQYLKHFPEYFAPDPAFPLPRELASQEDPVGAARTARVPQPPVVCAPVQQGGYGVVTVTAQPFVTPAPLKPAHMGTWVRMIGSKQCVVKVEGDHLTVTVSEAREIDGNTVTRHLTFTADYQLSRDGQTAVGLITSVDAKFDGDMPEDEEEAMLEKVAGMQRALEEKPFAMTFRRYGEALVIGNVRMPEFGERGMDTPPGAYIGGRYASVGDKPLPKLKTVKVSPPPPAPPVYTPLTAPLIGAPAQPGIYELPPDRPRLVSPPAPTGELLPPQALPCPTAPRPVGAAVPVGVGSQRRIVEVVEESWAPPPAVAPTPPARVMPQPVPPAVLMPQPLPLALDLGLPVVPSLSKTPKSDHDNKQIFNFVIGLFGNQ